MQHSYAKLGALEQSNRIPSKDKFRMMPCKTFIMCGACPYHERCVFLHDPRIRAIAPRARPIRALRSESSSARDSFYWPDMKMGEIIKQMDDNQLPTADQQYEIPASFGTAKTIHDRAVYSMWMHLVQFCSTHTYHQQQYQQYQQYQQHQQRQVQLQPHGQVSGLSVTSDGSSSGFRASPAGIAELSPFGFNCQQQGRSTTPSSMAAAAAPFVPTSPSPQLQHAACVHTHSPVPPLSYGAAAGAAASAPARRSHSGGSRSLWDSGSDSNPPTVGGKVHTVPSVGGAAEGGEYDSGVSAQHQVSRCNALPNRFLGTHRLPFFVYLAHNDGYTTSSSYPVPKTSSTSGLQKQQQQQQSPQGQNHGQGHGHLQQQYGYAHLQQQQSQKGHQLQFQAHRQQQYPHDPSDAPPGMGLPHHQWAEADEGVAMGKAWQPLSYAISTTGHPQRLQQPQHQHQYQQQSFGQAHLLQQAEKAPLMVPPISGRRMRRLTKSTTADGNSTRRAATPLSPSAPPFASAFAASSFQPSQQVDATAVNSGDDPRADSISSSSATFDQMFPPFSAPQQTQSPLPPTGYTATLRKQHSASPLSASPSGLAAATEAISPIYSGGSGDSTGLHAPLSSMDWGTPSLYPPSPSPLSSAQSSTQSLAPWGALDDSGSFLGKGSLSAQTMLPHASPQAGVNRTPTPSGGLFEAGDGSLQDILDLYSMDDAATAPCCKQFAITEDDESEES